MSELTPPIRTTTELGWLRRPEFNRAAGHVYELPDGSLVLIEPVSRPTLAMARAQFSALTDADREYLAWRAKRDQP